MRNALLFGQTTRSSNPFAFWPAWFLFVTGASLWLVGRLVEDQAEQRMMREMNRQADLFRHLVDKHARIEAFAWRQSLGAGTVSDQNSAIENSSDLRGVNAATMKILRDPIKPSRPGSALRSERQAKRFWDALQTNKVATAWQSDPVSASGRSAAEIWLAAGFGEPIVDHAWIKKVQASDFVSDAIPTGTTGEQLRVDLVDSQGNWMASLPASERPDDWRSSELVQQLIRGGSGFQGDGGLRRENARGDANRAAAWRWSPAGNYGLILQTDRGPWIGIVMWIRLMGMVCVGLGSISFAWRFRHRVIATAKEKHQGGEGDRDQIPKSLGEYELGEKLGEGGMGEVYQATHRALKRHVAIKLLRRASDHPTAVQRFEREVQLTARLRHPNTIAIYDFGQTPGGVFYYVMEFIDGLTLQDLVDQFGPQPPSRVIHLLLQICGSLSEAHGMGLIHRDIKPANILVSNGVGTGDLVKVLDFGLIKELQPEVANDPLLTRNDSITGTPMYMSPEAVRDAASANTQSDLYSAAAVGYTLLAGTTMFEAGSSVEVCVRQMNEVPPPPSARLRSELPADLEAVLMTALEKDPGKRWMSVDDFASALRRCGNAGAWTPDAAEAWWSDAEATIRSEEFQSRSGSPDPTVVG